MQITAVELSAIRRMEAVSFRSFPASTTHFNGTWAIRLTTGHPAKRLNSINPLDPDDSLNIEFRLKQEIVRFVEFGRPVVVRITPLASSNLVEYLDVAGWTKFDESVVMVLDLQKLNLDKITPHLPYQDTEHWVDAVLNMEGDDKKLKRGLIEIIKATPAQTGLFLLEGDMSQPYSALRAVLDDDLIGLFDIVTATEKRRQGLAASLILCALQWASKKGAKRAWLQVVKANKSGISLYESIGFSELYRYVYRSPQTSSPPGT